MLLKVLYINEKGRYRQVYLQRTNGRIWGLRHNNKTLG
jgi:hypothetical protein